METGQNSKRRMHYLIKILMEETDDNHSLSMPEIINRLADYSITTQRKAIYDDLKDLEALDIDVIKEGTGPHSRYHIGSRDFEMAELKLLVDAVQSSRFITNRKSMQLIKKLETLTSNQQAKQLQRQVMISGRIKTMNESIYYNIDTLHDAINTNSQIKFLYFQWNTKKEMELRNEGQWYQVSPWALVWNDEFYYLIAYDAQAGLIKHYRVDKMLKISILSADREGQEQYEAFDMAQYSQALFGMFGGSQSRVTLEAENWAVGILIDRFGKDIPIITVDENHVQTTVDVFVSVQFIGWVFGLGCAVRIVGPEAVVEQMKEQLQRQGEMYADGN